MNIELTVRCRLCQREWQPDHSHYVRGEWRVCDECRYGYVKTPWEGASTLSDDSTASGEATTKGHDR